MLRNYAAPIAGMVLIIATIVYVVWGRKVYNGPLYDLPGVMVDTVAIQETDEITMKEKM